MIRNSYNPLQSKAKWAIPQSTNSQRVNRVSGFFPEGGQLCCLDFEVYTQFSDVTVTNLENFNLVYLLSLP